MRPVLFNLGPFTIYTWGLLLGLAVIIGTIFAYRRAQKENLPAENIIDLVIFIVVGGVAGARLFYVIFYEPGTYFENPLLIFALWEGGLVFYGGLIGGFLAGLWYLKKKNLPFWKLADLLAPYLALGYGIVRIGCFFNGCCYGRPTNSIWGVVFPHLDNVFRYPTQLYSSALGFLLFGILLYVRNHKKFDGQVFLLFLILYSVGRGIIETFRENLTVFGPITIAQLVSFIILIVAVVIYKYKREKI